MEKEKALELKKILKTRLNRPMRYYVDTCTRCGLCYDTCHAFQGIPKKEYSPVGRAEVVRKLYKKYTRASGFLFPYGTDATKFDDTVMVQSEVTAAQFEEELKGKSKFSCKGSLQCGRKGFVLPVFPHSKSAMNPTFMILQQKAK